MASKKAAVPADELGIDLGALSATFLGGIGDALEKASGSAAAICKFVKLAVIAEDPDNPRRHFDAAALKELAEVIKERGFNSAIRVRKNPAKPGHFLICEGHRRYRAAAMAGLKEIPVLISDNFERLDQVLENLKRVPLNEFEMAAFIKDQIAQGVKKIDLAKRMRVSPAYITQHLALLNMSETLAKAYGQNRVRDLSSVGSLVNLEKSHPREVAAFLEGKEEITRNDIALLKTRLEKGEAADHAALPESAASGIGDLGRGAPMRKAAPREEHPEEGLAATLETPEPSPSGLAKARTSHPPLTVFVKAGGKEARLLTNREAKSPRHAWIRFVDNGVEKEIALRELAIFEVRRG